METWNLGEMNFLERATRAFDLIQDVGDFIAFDEWAGEAVLQAQGKIEEVIWNLEEDAHYYDQFDHRHYYS